MPNPCAKSRPKTDPYEMWDMGFCHYLILKKWSSPEKEAADPYARWYVYTVGEYNEYGDMYAADIKRLGRQVQPGSPRWQRVMSEV